MNSSSWTPGSLGSDRSAFVSRVASVRLTRDRAGGPARNLPETVLHEISRHPTPRSSTAPSLRGCTVTGGTARRREPPAHRWHARAQSMWGGRTVITRRPGLPSTFPPPDARSCGTGRNRPGRRMTAEAVDTPSAHVKPDDGEHMGMGRDPRGDGGATCKIAGIAYTGSNPVPATLDSSC
jgi:hypothetical protein